jgi:hypothetical protein
MNARTILIVCGIVVVSGIILAVCALAAIGYGSSRAIHIEFPSDMPMSDGDAIEMSKQAMILDGKQTDAMRPIPWGPVGSPRGDLFFARVEGKRDEGDVLWWLGSRNQLWEYTVHVSRKGDKVICTIRKPH